MPIGTSIGAYFDDEFSHAAGLDTADQNIVKPPATKDNSEYDAEESTSKIERAPARVIKTGDEPYKGPDLGPLSGMLNGSREKLTGAFNSQPGTPVAPSENSSPEPSDSLPDIDDVPEYDWLDHAIKGGVSSFINALRYPGDVLSGEKPLSVEGITNMGLNLVGAPASVVERDPNVLGSFAGIRSKTLPVDQLNQAKQLYSEGAHPDDIWSKTGFFLGRDDNWRYEIPSNTSKLNMDNLNTNGLTVQPKYTPAPPPGASLKDILVHIDQPTYKVGDILDHPELYKAYPFLQNITVKGFDKPVPGVYGGYHHASNTMFLGPQTQSEMHKTLLHELQHAIQEREGFATGGNYQQFLTPEHHQLVKQFTDAATAKITLLRKRYGMSNGDFQNIFDNIVGKTKEPLSPAQNAIMDDMIKNGDIESLRDISRGLNHIQQAEREAKTKYYKLAGEVEARDVENRRLMGPMTRKMNPPWRMLNRPPDEEQIFSFGNTVNYKDEPLDFRKADNDNTQGLYNPREPDMIGSKELDDWIDNLFKTFSEDSKKSMELSNQLHEMGEFLRQPGNWTELNVARYNKIAKQLHDLNKNSPEEQFEPMSFNPFETKTSASYDLPPEEEKPPVKQKTAAKQMEEKAKAYKNWLDTQDARDGIFDALNDPDKIE